MCPVFRFKQLAGVNLAKSVISGICFAGAWCRYALEWTGESSLKSSLTHYPRCWGDKAFSLVGTRKYRYLKCYISSFSWLCYGEGAREPLRSSNLLVLRIQSRKDVILERAKQLQWQDMSDAGSLKFERLAMNVIVTPTCRAIASRFCHKFIDALSLGAATAADRLARMILLGSPGTSSFRSHMQQGRFLYRSSPFIAFY